MLPSQVALYNITIFVTGGLIVQGPFEHGTYPTSEIRVWNATTGELLLLGTDVGNLTAGGGVVAYGNVYYPCRGDMKVRAISLSTGKVVWTSDPMEYPWGAFTAYGAAAAYNKVYINSYDGYLYCFDANTGKTVWKYYSGNTTENAFGTYPWWGHAVIADGKVYAATGEHTAPDPDPRGNRLYCLNANTGKLIWKLPGFYGTARGSNGISSGMLWYDNQYDGCSTCSARAKRHNSFSTTDYCTAGSSVLIQGTVTDQSPGAKGTPAISDERQSAWMEYLYMNADQCPRTQRALQ